MNFVDNEYSDEFYDKTYNKGRMAILLYDGCVNYISFSGIGDGRNSSVQSVPTAFNFFYNSKIENKRLYFYFLDTKENLETEYHLFMYRLMSTIGFEFINSDEMISSEIMPFYTIDDIISARKNNKVKNKSNNSTYITKSDKLKIDIYGKTYGASKYESAMICYAISQLASQKQKVTLYQVIEQGLVEIPKPCKDIINQMNVIDIVRTDMKLERQVFNENNSLRSPHYIYNLFEKFGDKKCAFCSCEIPESIQGAHIWEVAKIKKYPSSPEQKLKWATDGENGLWLCNSHHKWFDEDLIRISLNGDILIEDSLESHNKQYIETLTTVKQLPEEYISPEFIYYLKKRYNLD